jgi:hypothetical protein
MIFTVDMIIAVHERLDEVVRVGLSIANGSMGYQELLTWVRKITQ